MLRKNLKSKGFENHIYHFITRCKVWKTCAFSNYWVNRILKLRPPPYRSALGEGRLPRDGSELDDVELGHDAAVRLHGLLREGDNLRLLRVAGHLEGAESSGVRLDVRWRCKFSLCRNQ